MNRVESPSPSTDYCGWRIGLHSSTSNSGAVCCQSRNKSRCVLPINSAEIQHGSVQRGLSQADKLPRHCCTTSPTDRRLLWQANPFRVEFPDFTVDLSPTTTSALIGGFWTGSARLPTQRPVCLGVKTKIARFHFAIIALNVEC